MYEPAEINGNVAAVLNVDEVLPLTYIVVYVPSVHTGIFVKQSSSFTTAASNPGEFAASVAVFSRYVPTVNLPPEYRYVPICWWNSLCDSQSIKPCTSFNPKEVADVAL